MTVKQLINRLKKCKPTAEVIMSSDEEGNAIHPLEEVEEYGKTTNHPTGQVCLWPAHINVEF